MAMAIADNERLAQAAWLTASLAHRHDACFQARGPRQGSLSLTEQVYEISKLVVA